MLGMSLFTFIHVLLSLVGIVSGLIVASGLLRSRHFGAWTLLFLSTTLATSLTGFGFNRDHLLPSHVVGIISLVLLALAILALYVFALARSWRRVYVVCAIIALYLNVFVLVVQAFQKLPTLHDLAPTQSELPFVAVQAIVLVAFVILGTRAAVRFRG
jgi:hypothetical protein